jgi:hypothetical protein
LVCIFKQIFYTNYLSELTIKHYETKLRMIAMAVVLPQQLVHLDQLLYRGSDAQSATADGLTAGFTVAWHNIVSSGGVYYRL